MADSKNGRVNFTEWNQKNFQRNLASLQEILNKNGKDLGEKLTLLHRQQISAGFIEDDLSEVMRAWAINPRDGADKFLMQYNPRRANRRKGAGRATVPEGITPINDGCFLCKDNIAWQQQGVEMGYSFKVNENPYWAWCNPFPLMPNHMIIASEVHEPQGWILGNKKENFAKIKRIANDLLKITSTAGEFIGFYNGIKAGATIPGHLHYQFFKRQLGHAPFPLENAAKTLAVAGHRTPFIIDGYPITCFYFNGDRETILEQVVDRMCEWTEACGHAPSLSANITVTLDKKGSDQTKDTYNLYLTPRDTYFAISPGRKGIVGGLEIFGEIAFSDPEEFKRMQEGSITYDSIVQILRAVEPQLVHDLINRTRFTC